MIIEPDAAYGYLQVGKVLTITGDTIEARWQLELAIERDP